MFKLLLPIIKERMLIVMAIKEERNLWRTYTPDNTLSDSWQEIIYRLRSLKEVRDESGKLAGASILHFTDDAAKAMLAYQNQETNCDFDLDERNQARIVAKAEVYGLRFAIIFHCLENAYANADTPLIDVPTVERAIKLTEYYKQSAFSLWETLGKKNPLDYLSEQKLNIYDSLSAVFTTQQGLFKAQKFGMAERTFKYWIKNDITLFKRLGHGSFAKRYQK
ncbi:MAG: DUF3987 domain-containing protein [Proteobacteria bacterium]|nr:MAG: DUF3987 domain-containing protein [Pseudomonadota bacterium]